MSGVSGEGKARSSAGRWSPLSLTHLPVVPPSTRRGLCERSGEPRNGSREHGMCARRGSLEHLVLCTASRLPFCRHPAETISPPTPWALALQPLALHGSVEMTGGSDGRL